MKKCYGKKMNRKYVGTNKMRKSTKKFLMKMHQTQNLIDFLHTIRNAMVLNPETVNTKYSN